MPGPNAHTSRSQGVPLQHSLWHRFPAICTTNNNLQLINVVSTTHYILDPNQNAVAKGFVGHEKDCSLRCHNRNKAHNRLAKPDLLLCKVCLTRSGVADPASLVCRCPSSDIFPPLPTSSPDCSDRKSDLAQEVLPCGIGAASSDPAWITRGRSFMSVCATLGELPTEMRRLLELARPFPFRLLHPCYPRG